MSKIYQQFVNGQEPELDISTEGLLETIKDRASVLGTQNRGMFSVFSFDNAKGLAKRLLTLKNRLDDISEEKSIMVPKSAKALMVGNEVPSSASDLKDSLEAFAALYDVIFNDFQLSVIDGISKVRMTDYNLDKFFDAFSAVKYDGLRKYCHETKVINDKSLKVSPVLPGNKRLICKLAPNEKRLSNVTSEEDLEIIWKEVYDVVSVEKAKVPKETEMTGISASEARGLITAMDDILDDIIMNKGRLKAREYTMYAMTMANLGVAKKSVYLNTLMTMYVSPAGQARTAILDGIEAIIQILEGLAKAKVSAE